MQKLVGIISHLGRRSRRVLVLSVQAKSRLAFPFAALTIQLLAIAGLAAGLPSTAQAAPAGALLSYYGGKIVEHPSYVNVYWGEHWQTATGYAERAAMNNFVNIVGSSAEFASVLGQYTGPGGASPQLGSYLGERLISGEPGGGSKIISDDQIQTAWQADIAEGLVPAPSPDVIYNLFLPPGVTVTLGADASGISFCAYHYTAPTTFGTGGSIRYTVTPYPDMAGCQFGPTIVDSLTVISSHSMAEVVTDPDIGLANQTNLDTYLGWYDNNNGEIGDICAVDPDVTLLGFRVQTLWSNADGKCVASRLAPADTTPPLITPALSGTLGNSGWYTSDVLASWTVSDLESAVSSTTGCGPTTVGTDSAGTILACSATSAGGTATQSITVKRDATPPTITYAGNAGAYTTDQNVSIQCTATDALSGVATSTCQPISGPAYSFNIGSNSFSASATDIAGNVAAATTTFVVTASSGSAAHLTQQFVDASAKYQSLSSRQRVFVNAVVDFMARLLTSIKPGLSAIQKTILIDTYKALAATLGQAGLLSAGQIAVLDKIADAL